MSIFGCPICETLFNHFENQPRIIDCGHTICTSCLQSLISQSKSSQLFCPEDSEPLINFRPEKGVNSFPVNKVLLQTQKGQKPQKTTHETGTRISNLNSLNFCEKHNKLREIVCQTEAVVICPDCACSAEHKSHDLLNSHDFQLFLIDNLTKAKKEVELLKEKPLFENQSLVFEKWETEISKRKNQLYFDLQSVFDFLQNSLFQRQKKIADQIEVCFGEVFGKLEFFKSESEKNERQKTELFSKLEKTRNFVNKVDFDFNAVLDFWCKNTGANQAFLLISQKCEQISRDLETDMAQLFRKTSVKSKNQNEAESFLENFVSLQLFSANRPKSSSLINKAQANRSLSCLKPELAQSKPCVLAQPYNLDIKIEESFNDPLSANKSASFVNSKKPASSVLPKPVSHEIVANENRQPVLREFNLHESQGSIAKKYTLSHKSSPLGLLQPDLQIVIEDTHHVQDKPLFLQKSKASKVDLSFDEDELLEISADNFDVSVSILDSISAKKEALSKSLLEEDFDPSDLSLLDDSSPSKGQHQPKVAKNVNNNSFIRTREESPFEIPRELSVSVNFVSHLSRVDPQPSMLASLSRKLVGSKSNNAMSTNASDQKPKPPILSQLKTQFSSNNFVSNQLNRQLPGSIPIPDPLNLNINHSAIIKLPSNPKKINLRTVVGIEPGQSFLELATLSNPYSQRQIIGRPRTVSSQSSALLSLNPALRKTEVSSRLESTLFGKNEKSGIIKNSECGVLANQRQTVNSQINAKMVSLDDQSLEINLANKRLNDSTLSIQFSEILKHKKAKTLNLTGNFITEVGVGSILKNLAAHPTLEKIILRQNYIGENIFSLLRNSTAIIKKIRFFDVRENQEKIDRSKIKTEVTALKKINIFLEISSK